MAVLLYQDWKKHGGHLPIGKAKSWQHWALLTPGHWCQGTWVEVLAPGRHIGLGPWPLWCAQSSHGTSSQLPMAAVIYSHLLSPWWLQRYPCVGSSWEKGRRQWQLSLQDMICLWLSSPDAAKRSFKLQLRVLRKSLFLRSVLQST